jgi:targeting protein for Xklp2
VNILETENLQRRALRNAEDVKEIATYRKGLVHKANPIHHYAPLVIKPSDRPITQPISPHFEIDRVLKNKFYTKV